MLGAKNKKDMNPKFDRPSITVKTVFKIDDFSGYKTSRENAHKIFYFVLSIKIGSFCFSIDSQLLSSFKTSLTIN